MRVRPIQEGDYEVFCGWWDSRGFPRIPKEILPDGWVVEDGGVPILAGWLYLPQGDPMPKIGMFMWPVSNPEAASEARNRAWNHLMSKVDFEARSKGLWMVFTGTAHEPLIERMETHGYVSYETGSANMLKQIERIIVL